MLVGVKFCGGCNPRYDRGKALQAVKEQTQGDAEFVTAEEGILYDRLLVIGGCTNCCASYGQYQSKNGIIRMWDESHIENVIEEIKKLNNENNKVIMGGMTIELEGNIQQQVMHRR